MRNIFLILFSLTIIIGCQHTKRVIAHSTQYGILIKDELIKLTPDSVINILKDGNNNFINKRPSKRDAMAQIAISAQVGQSPMAIILSCIDSRVPVETIFDKGVGDLFVARIAGNIVNQDILGSMEYACAHSGAKLIVVLGHQDCGAVYAACQGVREGNMTHVLLKIQPAIDSCITTKTDIHSDYFQNKVIYQHTRNMIENIRNGSESLSFLESKGKIKIVGAIFNLNNGTVEFL